MNFKKLHQTRMLREHISEQQRYFFKHLNNDDEH